MASVQQEGMNEMKQVKAEIEEVKAKIEKTEAKIERIEMDLQQPGLSSEGMDDLKKKEAQLRSDLHDDKQQLALLRQEKLKLMDMMSAAAGTEGAGVSGPPKTVEVVIPPVLHGDEIEYILVTFRNQADFSDWLSTQQLGGLMKVAEPEDKSVIRELDKLLPDTIYTPSGIGKEAFKRVLGEVRHLQQSREDEYARGLEAIVQAMEPTQGYKLEDSLRYQLIEGGKLAEHDVVITGNDKAYIGSHKTYAKSAKPVKEIAARCKELAKLDNALPADIKPSFMAERVETRAEPTIQKACKDLGVLRVQRSGKAISVVSHMRGASCRLLRF